MAKPITVKQMKNFLDSFEHACIDGNEARRDGLRIEIAKRFSDVLRFIPESLDNPSSGPFILPEGIAGFQKRVFEHDKVATPIVARKFIDRGFKLTKWGTEYDSEEFKWQLCVLEDQSSIMTRFRPDIAAAGERRSVWCEIKSESGTSENYAIEIDALRSGMWWNQNCRHIMYIFVDLELDEREYLLLSVRACWADEIPFPDTILVPTLSGWEDRVRKLEELYRQEINSHRLRIHVFQHKKGTGIPFFTLPKNASYLIDFDRFVEREIE